MTTLLGTSVAVMGAAGMQAAAIARAFARHGSNVRGLTRDRTKTADVQAAGATPVIADPSDPDNLAAAIDGAEVLAFTAPVDYRPGVREGLAEALVRAAERAGVSRIVLNTGAEAFEDYDRPVSRSLLAVRKILASSSVPSVVVQPTVFMDNLLGPWSAASIVNEGLFAYPIAPEWPIAWISHHALGEAVVAAARHGQAGLVYRVGGPAALTANDVARILSSAVGRRVVHVPVPFDDFATKLNRALGAPTGDGVADYYRYLEQRPDALATRDGSEVLGLAPESFVDWAARQRWSAFRTAA